MTEKEKSIRKLVSMKETIALILPMTVATLIVSFSLVPAETLGYWADAYTVALILTLVILGAIIAIRQKM